MFVTLDCHGATRLAMTQSEVITQQHIAWQTNAESAYAGRMTDVSETNPPPVCACKAVHGFDCQFPDASAVFKFAEQDWCMFHLPLKNRAGNQSDKDLCTAGWERSGAEWEKFETEVLNRLTAASNPGRSKADLRHVVFPPGFSFHRRAAIYPEIHGDFEHATFGNNINFDGITELPPENRTVTEATI